MDLLESLRPKPKYVRLFREIVLDAFQDRHLEMVHLRRHLDRKLEDIRLRKDRVVDAFVHDGLLDRGTYEEQLARLNEEMTMARLRRNEAETDELDVEGILEFGERLLLHVARLWAEADLRQRRVLQRFLFPAGVRFDGEKLETAEISPAFTYLREIESQESRLVSPGGFEPPLPA